MTCDPYQHVCCPNDVGESRASSPAARLLQDNVLGRLLYAAREARLDLHRAPCFTHAPRPLAANQAAGVDHVDTPFDASLPGNNNVNT